MKSFSSLITGALIFFAISSQAQNVGIGTTAPDSSAVVEIASTDRGVLLPRLTTTQRVAVSKLAIGLLVFDSTTESFWFYETTGWLEVQDRRFEYYHCRFGRGNQVSC